MNRGVTSRIPQMQAVCILISRQGAPLAQITTTRLTYNLGRVQSRFRKPLLNKSRTKELKAKITMFTQEEEEPFSDAWNRFKEYTRECPHHGISESRLLCTFYEGVVWDVRMILDTASNGNFLTRNEEDSKILLNNFASVSLDDMPNYARVNSQRTECIERLTKQLEELSQRNGGMESSLVRSKSPLYVCETGQRNAAARDSANLCKARGPNESRLEDILENILASQWQIEARCDTLEEQLKQPTPINALILQSGKALDERYQQTQEEEPIAAEESPTEARSKGCRKRRRLCGRKK